MGFCCSGTSEPIKMPPRNLWDGQKTWEKTDCYRKFMNRNWYFQATTAEGGAAADLNDFFVECYGWNPGMEGKTGVVGFNHTMDRKCGGQLTDYPNWKVTIDEKTLEISATPKMFWGLINAPVDMRMQFMCFPENDRRDQCWTWLGSLGGMEFIVIASLEPRMSDSDYQKELDRLVMENGVDLDKWKFTRTQTDPNHVEQSLGENFVNPAPYSQH